MMEADLKKEVELANPNSRTVVDSELAESKGKKKKKVCTCKGFTEEVSRAKKQKQKFQSSAWLREQTIWKEFIRKQRKDLRNAKPLVDDSAPKLNVSNIYDTETLKGLFGGLKGAFEVNRFLVRSLHQVNVLPGKTDTFTFNYSTPQTSNYAARKDEAKGIEKQNRIILKALKNPTLRVKSVKEYAEEYERFEALVESSSDFPLWWKVQQQEESVEVGPPSHYFEQHVTEKSAKYPDKRPRVSLEISIRNVGVVGRMVAVLYSDYVPMTVKNFLAFCNPKAPLTYKGNLFYFIFPGYYCQTGDVVENRGFGGTSIYGPYFGNEDFTLKHKERGNLTMYTKLPNRNASQFLITFRQLESLDGKNVVFGKVVKGLHVLEAIESVGSRKTGRPKVEIFISDCDEI